MIILLRTMIALMAAALAAAAIAASPEVVPWADFAPASSGHAGNLVKLIALSDKPGDATGEPFSVAESTVRVAGRIGNANGSLWSTLGIEVAGNATLAPVDLSSTQQLRIRLSASAPRVLRIRLKGPDTTTQNLGCYPVMLQRVSTRLTDFVIPLAAFEPEPHCGAQGASVSRTLRAITHVEVTANEVSADPVRFQVGRIEFLAGTPGQQIRADAQAEGRSPRWKLAWSDEFNAGAGVPADNNRWLLHRGETGPPNQGRRYERDTTRDASNDGAGHFALRVHGSRDPGLRCSYGPCAYTSARLQTKPSVAMLYGRIEIRLRLPTAPGVAVRASLQGAPLTELPWLDAGEITLFESIGRDPLVFAVGLQGPGIGDDLAYRGRFAKGAATAPGEDFHLLAFEWEPAGMRWFLDEVLIKTILRAELPALSRDAFERWPFHLAVGLAAEGDVAGDAQASLPTDTQLLIDHVRVFQREDLTSAARARLGAWHAAMADRNADGKTGPASAAPTDHRRGAKPVAARRHGVASASDGPSPQPVRQVICERNKFGLMMCY